MVRDWCFEINYERNMMNYGPMEEQQSKSDMIQLLQIIVTMHAEKHVGYRV